MLEPRDVARYERELRAMVSNVSANDPEAFAVLVRLADWLNKEGLSTAADGLRMIGGYSWSEIARPLGVSKSAAFQRFGAR